MSNGSAFERISAFQFGFTDGAAACSTITPKRDRGAGGICRWNRPATIPRRKLPVAPSVSAPSTR